MSSLTSNLQPPNPFQAVSSASSLKTNAMVKYYNSDGTPDNGRILCSVDGNPAQCCGQGEVCSSNGLCLNIQENGKTSYWLNTYTDPD